MMPLLVLYGGLGVVLGHNYPCYLHFKGGKGIAATAGVIITMDWRITLVCLAAFCDQRAPATTDRVGRLPSWWVSLFPDHVADPRADGAPSSGGENIMLESYVIVLLFAALAYWRHRANIKRLLNGTENRFGSKK